LPRIEIGWFGEERPLTEGGESAEAVAEVELLAESVGKLAARCVAPVG
jgi:hypothetical protein